ncbi:MAG: hypothetical protein ACFFG0_22600 [Candidatus Thorarchaeota archaeon]
MTQAELKKLFEDGGLKVEKISGEERNIIWSYKMSNPTNELIAAEALKDKGIEIAEKAGYEINGSGVYEGIYYINITNPVHSEGYEAPEPEPTPEPAPIEKKAEVSAPDTVNEQ